MKVPTWLKLGLLIIGATVLQSAFVHQWKVAGVQPDLNKLVIIAIAVNVSALQAATYGFIGGWILGTTVGVSVGSFIVSRMTMAWLLGLLEARLFRDNPIVLMFSAFTGSMLCEAVFFLFSPLPDPPRWAKQAIGESLYTLLLVLPVTAGVRRILA